MGEFRMPSLGADMDEGTLLEWLVKPGDPVHRGDIVAVVDTAKAVMDIESFEDGVVEQLLTQPGTTLPVGAPMAIFGSGSAGAAEPVPVTPPEAAPLTAVQPAAAPPAEVPAAAVPPAEAPARRVVSPLTRRRARRAPALPRRRIAASPLARRRAAELGVDLSGLEGSGPSGAITQADVERAATGHAPVPAAAPAVAPSDTESRARAMRRAIGALMARSKREIPHYYLSTTIDLTKAMSWLRQANLERPMSQRLVPAALLLKAVALGVRAMPEVNGFWLDGGFVAGDGVHLGVAVALRQGGLVAPAIHHADTLSVDDLMAQLRDLVTRARAGRLRQSEMDPTLTVTNLGDQGVEAVFGVIYPPQVALVGFGRVIERPWADGGMLGVRPTITATLSADHRASDGHRGGLFLAAVDALLQKPEEL